MSISSGQWENFWEIGKATFPSGSSESHLHLTVLGYFPKIHIPKPTLATDALGPRNLPSANILNILTF